jgi:hypothetical protein
VTNFYHLIILEHHLINPVICSDLFLVVNFIFKKFGNFWEKKWGFSFFSAKKSHLQNKT